MKTHPPNKPEFTCGSCRELMCDDCASMAAEYEFLYGQQRFELMDVRRQLEEMSRELASWKRRAEAFEHVAKIGYSEVIQGYLDSMADSLARQYSAAETIRRMPVINDPAIHEAMEDLP